jgi:transposase
MFLEAIVKRCAGLDVHKMTVVATVLIEQTNGEVYQESRTFGTFRGDRRQLCEWLKGHGVELVVMESTGNYWKSIYAALESAHLNAYVVNARQVKQVPGRKTDLNDSQWLAMLARYGLLKPSFIAPVDLQQLRLLSRYRMKLKAMIASETNRLHKVLDDAGIRLGGVVSDLGGVSAQAMIEGLIAGEPLAKLIEYARGSMKKKREQLRQALDDPLSPRHRLLLQELQAHRQFLIQHLQQIDEHLLESMKPYESAWQLLQTIPGIDRISAAMILIEIGVDMTRFGSGERLASWSGLCPGNSESGGKRLSGRCRKGNRQLRQLLCECAHAASKTNSQFKGKYRALVIRRGCKRSIIALAHKLIRVIYCVLHSQQPYSDPGIDYEALVIAKNAPRWLKALEQYGYLSQVQPAAA